MAYLEIGEGDRHLPGLLEGPWAVGIDHDRDPVARRLASGWMDLSVVVVAIALGDTEGHGIAVAVPISLLGIGHAVAVDPIAQLRRTGIDRGVQVVAVAAGRGRPSRPAIRRAVAGMSCISPCAPTGEVTAGWNNDSVRTTA